MPDIYNDLMGIDGSKNIGKTLAKQWLKHWYKHCPPLVLIGKLTVLSFIGSN
jgi:hypothetical protein